MSDYTSYYQKKYVLLELLKATLPAFREIALLPYKEKFIDEDGKERIRTIGVDGLGKGAVMRNINARNLTYLLKNFEVYHFFQKAYKIYFSLATFSEYPTFTFNFQLRKEQQREWAKTLMENPERYLVAYDFAVDIDGKDLEKGLKQAKTVRDILDSFGIPYYLNSSGGKLGGFHFRIPYKFFEDKITPVDMIRATYIINREFEEVENLPDCDTSIFDLRRIFKIPFSLVYGANEKWNVCLPMKGADLDNYSPDQIEVSNVLRNVPIKNRGIILNNADGEHDFKGFLEQYYYEPLASGTYD